MVSSFQHTEKCHGLTGQRPNSILSFTSIWDPIVEIRRSQDRPIPPVVFHLLVKWHLCIKTAPNTYGPLCYLECHKVWLDSHKRLQDRDSHSSGPGSPPLDSFGTVGSGLVVKKIYVSLLRSVCIYTSSTVCILLALLIVSVTNQYAHNYTCIIQF